MVRFPYIYLSVILMLSAACSSGSSPVTPETPDKTIAETETLNIPIAISDYAEDGSPIAGTGILGLFDVSIDAANLKGEIVPLRFTGAADVYEVVDITTMLSGSPCMDCVKLESIGMDDDGNLVLRIGIRHPIPMGNPEEPITGQNRGDLMVYNVEGLIVTDGIATFSALEQVVPVTKLINADGYSSYLDKSLDRIFNTSATIHPYITHFKDYSQGNYDPDSYPQTGFPPPPVTPEGNMVMSQGSDFDSRDYIFDLKNSMKLNYIYAVQCTFGITATDKTQRFQPESRVPQHNKKAASEVHVSIVSNGLTGNVVNSQAIIQIKVLDMNHGVGLGDALNQMYAFSDVKEIQMMIPSITASPVVLDNFPSPLTGDPRDPDNPMIFQMTITNSGNARPGNYYGLCKVLDSYTPGQNQIIPGADGIARLKPDETTYDGLFAIPEFATYQVFQISVAEDPDVTLLYEADPFRTSIHISDPSLRFPVDPNGELDIGVCENMFEPDIDGIYMFDENQQIVRFDRNYQNSVFQAPGLLPKNDTGDHPNPDEPMPGYRLDVAANGYVISCYDDSHKSWDLSYYDPSYTEPFPENNFWARWEPVIPRPSDYPPHPHKIFPVQVCFAGSPHEMPMAHEGWDESSFITVSSPAPGDPKGTLPYNQVDNVLSVMFRYTNQVLMDDDYGYAAVYYGHYPPYFNRDTFNLYSLFSYAWELYAVSADEIVGVDRSDKNWLYIVASGTKSMEAWNSASTENLFLIDAYQPGRPGWMLDLQTDLPTNATVLDVECIPYDPDNPIIFDDGSGGSVSQIAAIGAILFSDKRIHLISFDDTPGYEPSFLIYQSIDGSNAITGQPKRLDIGEETYDIHVTSSDGQNAYVTVFRLTAQ